jgi:7,8-dihydropterin-6-yl-methyl-4-(beta-D-ribofuranosyl)aminobenzene 5'-phosphate synthase
MVSVEQDRIFANVVTGLRQVAELIAGLPEARQLVAGVVNGFGCFPEKVSPAKNTGTFVPDDFEHEIGTSFLLKGKGLVILTSCSHRGIVNTIRQAQVTSGIQKVHAVIGGFHLLPPLTDDYFRQVIAALKEINPDYLMPAHCVGEPFYDMVRREMPEKVFQSNVGTRYLFTA